MAVYLCDWANFHNCKWPNVEQTICPSGRTVLEPLYLLLTIRNETIFDHFWICRSTLRRAKEIRKELAPFPGLEADSKFNCNFGDKRFKFMEDDGPAKDKYYK